jgi:hypothetical protein
VSCYLVSRFAGGQHAFERERRRGATHFGECRRSDIPARW